MNAINQSCCYKSDFENVPFVEILMPYADQFVRRLNSRLAAALVDKLLLNLLTELSFFAEVTLQHELNIFVKGGGDSLGAYTEKMSESLSSSYPVLDCMLTIKSINFANHVCNIIDRFQRDVPTIADTFGLNREQNALKIDDIDTGLGDGHNGAGTALVCLSDGTKLIYKPRNVGITTSYNLFVDWLNSKLHTDVKTFKVVEGVGYGWLEFVTESAVQSENDIDTYYFHAGVLLAVTFLLGSKDCHSENIISSGTSPVIVDHETIIQAYLSNQSMRSWDEHHKIPHFSVLESIMITNADCGIPLDFTGYGIGGMTQVTNLERKVINPNTLNSKRVTRFITHDLIKKNMPLYQGNYVFANAHRLSFIDGFIAAYKLFCHSKAELKSNHSPILTFANKEVRYVWRPTFVYYRILTYMRSAAYMSDFEAYKSKLNELLSRAYVGNHMNSYKFVLDREMQEMLVGDIPIFNLNSSDHTLYGIQKFRLFEHSCIENIYKRVDKLSNEHLNEQLGYIDKWLNIHVN